MLQRIRVCAVYCMYKATRSHMYMQNPRYLCEGTLDCGRRYGEAWLVNSKLEPFSNQSNRLITFRQHFFSVQIAFTWPSKSGKLFKGGGDKIVNWAASWDCGISNNKAIPDLVQCAQFSTHMPDYQVTWSLNKVIRHAFNGSSGSVV